MTGVVVALVLLSLLVGRRPHGTRLPLGRAAQRAPRVLLLERWLAPRLRAADLSWPADVAATGWVGALVVIGVTGLLAGGPVLGVMAAALAVGVPPAVLSSASGRLDARLERELPSLLEAVARSLRSGASLPTALREAGAGGSAAAAELAGVLAQVDRGRPLLEALDRWASDRPLPGVRLVVGALGVALTSGGTPARAIAGVASTLRERVEVDREVRALATQARTSALVVTLAPLAFAALGALGDERTADFLLRTPTGLGCLAIGLMLDGFGGWWMARIARGPA